MSIHLNHPLHNSKLLIPKHPKQLFEKTSDSKTERETASLNSDMVEMQEEEPAASVTKIVAGEPAPPGLEDEVEGECQIQATFDAYRSHPLIGLEYIVELVSTEEIAEPRYICLLCEKRGDPRSVIVHVTSQNHYLKYISCFFRTAGNALNMIPRTAEIRRGINIAIMKVAAEIEKHYGRLKPTSAESETFGSRKYEILRKIDEKQHFRETPSTTYADLVTMEKIKEYNNLPEDCIFDSPPRTAKKDERAGKRPFDNKKQKRELIEVEDDDDDDDVILVREEKPGANIDTKSLSSISTLSSSRSRSKSRDRARKSRGSTDSRYRRLPYSRHRSPSWSPRRSREYRRSRYSREKYYRNSPRRSRSRSGYKGSPQRYWRSPPRYSPERYRDRRYRSRSRSYERPKEYFREAPEIVREVKPRGDKIKWATFRESLAKVESEMAEQLKFFTSRPEKHPKYSEEWKEFWNKRYKEIQLSGQDPTRYDFKPEWVLHWNKRMKELHDQELADKKEDLRRRLDLDECRKMSGDLQDVSPPTPEDKDVTVDDIKNTWKAMTGSEIKAPNRSPSPWEETKATPPPPPPMKKEPSPVQKPPTSSGLYEIVPPIVHCLRMLLVLENQLGSFSHRVQEVFRQALALEKTKQSASMSLLQNRDIFFLMETIKEKFRGQLLAGIVPRNLVGTTKSVIKSIDCMLATNPLRPEAVKSFEPLKVGENMVDKMAVAQKIAAALVAQGKTDVSQEELEELINAVVGIAEKSNTIPTQGMSSAAFFSKLDIQNSTGSSHINSIISKMITNAQNSVGGPKEPPKPVVAPAPAPAPAPEPEPPKKPEISDEELKSRLVKFKDLPVEEQQSLIALLQSMESTHPQRVEKLREVVAASLAQETFRPEKKESSRLSPFSMRTGGANPSPEQKDPEKISDDDDDDDDYDFADVYRAASERLKLLQEEKKEKLEEPPAPPSTLGDSYDKIKNIINQLQQPQSQSQPVTAYESFPGQQSYASNYNYPGYPGYENAPQYSQFQPEPQPQPQSQSYPPIPPPYQSYNQYNNYGRY